MFSQKISVWTRPEHTGVFTLFKVLNCCQVHWSVKLKETHICTKIHSSHNMLTVLPRLAPKRLCEQAHPKLTPSVVRDSVVPGLPQSLALPRVGPPAACRDLALRPVFAGAGLCDHPIQPRERQAGRREAARETSNNTKRSNVFMFLTIVSVQCQPVPPD